jgi:hypothetical protein
MTAAIVGNRGEIATRRFRGLASSNANDKAG